MDAIDLGPSAKNKIAAIELLKLNAMDTPCEHNILESFHQSTSNLICDVKPPKGRMLLILGHLKSRWPPSTFNHIFTVKGKICL